jgi:leucyl/phenylalanyl-tRNA--protein transferase
MAFSAEDLLDCYRRGIFPMAETRTDASFFLVEPARRGVLPLKGFHVPRRLARRVRADPFEIRIDTAFSAVVALCAEGAPGRWETWINAPIERLYAELFAQGDAHSVEAWQDGRLVGGLYGVSIGGAFFGESMFSRATDASKVALVHLVGRLITGGYRLLDTQFVNDHLGQFGVEDIAKAEYLGQLKEALKGSGDFFALERQARGGVVLQAITQAS